MIKFPRAEFFDIFGVFVFTTILYLSWSSLATGNPIPRGGILFLLFIGISGIIVDGVVVYKTYLKRK